MLRHFAKNLNVNGTGAVIASPGAVPALHGACPGGYAWDWMRDGALCMATLLRLASGSTAPGAPRVSPSYARDVLHSYASWVSRLQSRQGIDIHTEPKWDISTGTPYPDSWCRPQTDGPGLRALALLAFAAGLGQASMSWLWPLIRVDLDWLAQGPGTIGLASCDLWEETVSNDFLWNRATMRLALVKGSEFAAYVMADPDTSSRYLSAANQFIGDPASGHVADLAGGYITECPAQNPSADCIKYGKGIDGAVILSLVHGEFFRATSVASARTVRAYNGAFCPYPINKQDTTAGVPGVLYGRYIKDGYGGGNPWVLITAALASLMYQAAATIAEGTTLDASELDAWQDALAWSEFGGTVSDFVAAGDAVLFRLRHHIDPAQGFHLYEQIDRVSGQQWNAKDLSWSYAEVLSALQRRSAVSSSPSAVLV